MPSGENRVIIACAGSGKTTRLVKESLVAADRRIAIVTYTNSNIQEIVKRFGELNSGVPKHVDIVSWFGFLLRECARPYQRSKCPANRIESLLFVNNRSGKRRAETDIRYYFASDDAIYSDKIAQFVVECEAKSHGSVTSRLRQIYTDILIDEFQDLAGWDLEVIKMLLGSSIRITLVGDPRQQTYTTNPSNKNSQYRGTRVVELVKLWRRCGLCEMADPMNGTHRCNQPICDCANALWPEMKDPMEALRNDMPEHAGVFLVAEKFVPEYVQRFHPQVLRYSRKAKCYDCEAMNFGVAKGLQFDRVLIVPTDPIKKYLRTGDPTCLKEESRNKLHVAITRARHSVAFVFDGRSPVVSKHFP
jgi:DNA helicase-2/ATP-dependent DNA helicase PcrA